MKVLTKAEVKEMSDELCMTIKEAQETADIFVKIYTEEQGNKVGWKIQLPLLNVDDYIEEWENHWHREVNWQEYYECEKEENLYCYGDTDEEAEEIFKDLETFKSAVKNSSYELSNGLIIVVC